MQRSVFIFITGASLLVFCGVLASVYFPHASEAQIDVGNFLGTDVSPELPGNPAVAGSEPTRIAIPSISVDAPVERVGITAKQTMAVPRSMHTVGWYRYGAAPGEKGVALFAGHVDNALGQAGVFARLENISRGDRVEVLDSEGKKLFFTVEDIRRVPYDFKDLGSIFGSSPDLSRITLITCGGIWIQSAKTYSERLVVTAVLTAESS